MHTEPVFLNAGDQALVIELGDAISPEINRRVHSLAAAIESQAIPAVVDLVPTYRSLLVRYDPLLISGDDLQETLAEIERPLAESPPEQPRVVLVPTLYGGEPGPDLDSVAEHTGLSPDEVIGLHSEVDYLVYMIGFTPGFPYLGGLSDRLATPRLDTPRTRIPAGSVGIAESQTGVYPIDSPGGWRLIGRTPLELFDPEREPPSLLAAGDYVRFLPLSGEEEYLRTRAQVESGEYQIVTTAKQ